ncbi:MAG: VCBS repeat-containing protein, partial [Thermodesulfobacteriota bacterium]|nr:VCBS repeat-containing protein [Thermodesulfobacteriota bacterium]
SVHAADLDGDGDMDILSAFRDADKVAWYENGNAWNETQISTNVNGPKSVYAADLDGDGDLDVLSASSGDDKIAWYKNKPGASLAPVIIMVLDEEEPAFRRR